MKIQKFFHTFAGGNLKQGENASLPQGDGCPWIPYKFYVSRNMHSCGVTYYYYSDLQYYNIDKPSACICLVNSCISNHMPIRGLVLMALRRGGYLGGLGGRSP